MKKELAGKTLSSNIESAKGGITPLFHIKPLAAALLAAGLAFNVQAAPFVYVPVKEDVGGGVYQKKLAIIDDAGVAAPVNSPILDGYVKGIAISSDGARVYAVVPNLTVGFELQVLDTSTNTIIGTVDLGTGWDLDYTTEPHGVTLSPDDATAYVALSDGLRIVDTRTLTQTGNIVAAAGYGVAWANGKVWASHGYSRVAVYDPATNTTTDIDSGAGAHYLLNVTANSDGSKVVACGTSGTGSAPWITVDTAANSFTVGATIIQPRACRIKSSGSFYISDMPGHAVKIYSSATGTYSGGISFGSGTYPSNIDFTPDESRLYVFPWSKSYVSVVNLADSSVSQSPLPTNTVTDADAHSFVGHFVGPATVADITPNTLTFTPASDATTGSTVESNVVTIAGLGAADRSPVGVVNGTYYYSSDNGQTWAGPTAAALAVANGDQLKVAVTASGTAGGSATASLYVGGIKSDFVATTQAAGNAAPTASNATVSGTATVGSTLTGSYTYADADSDAEGTSTFKWYSGTAADGSGKTAISGATATTYGVQAGDAGKYLFFEVTPVAATGTATGTAVVSTGTQQIPAPANAAPTASSVTVSGTATVGSTLGGDYSYADADSDAEGTSTFKWYSGTAADGSGKTAISGATATTYGVQAGDAGKYLFFEVTPVAATGTATGTAVVSAGTQQIPEPANAAPTASNVTICCTTTVIGSTLGGHYTYADADSDLEGASTFKWYRGTAADGSGKTAISGATAAAYVTLSIDAGKYLFFEVTPVAAAGTATGTAAVSAAVLIGSPPAILGLGSAAHGTIGIGNLDLSVVFDGPVTVDAAGGAPTLGITIGGQAKTATYQSQSADGATLSFRYVVQAGNGGVLAFPQNPLALNGATIRNAAGQDAILDLIAMTSGITVDTSTPVAAAAPAPSGDSGSYTPPAPTTTTVAPGGTTTIGATTTPVDAGVGSTLNVTAGTSGATINLPTPPATGTTTPSAVNVVIGGNNLSVKPTESGSVVKTATVSINGTSATVLNVTAGTAQVTASAANQPLVSVGSGGNAVVISSGSASATVIASVDKATGVTSLTLPRSATGNDTDAAVNVTIGGKDVSVKPQGGDAVVTLKTVSVGGQDVQVVSVVGGSATVTASQPNQPLLAIGSGSSAIVVTANSVGSEAATTVDSATGNTTLSITSGTITLPSNAFADAGNGFAAIKDGKLYAGEIAVLNSAGKISGVRLGSRSGSAASVGDPIKPASATGMAMNVTVPNLRGKVARVSDSQDFGDVIAASLGATANGQNSHGVLNLSISGLNVNALPTGDIIVDTSRADGVTVTGNGRVEVAKSGVIAGFVPAVADPTHLASQVTRLDKNASVTVNDYGVLQASLNGITYALQPGWVVSKANGGVAGFSMDAQGRFIYQDSTGNQQTLYPAFADLAQLVAAFKGSDANLSATGNDDGTVTAKFLGKTYTLTPDYALVPVPAEHAKDAWWPGADGKVYVKSGDGKTAQGFGVK